MKRKWLWLFGLLIVLVSTITVLALNSPALGGNISGQRLDRLRASSQYRDGAFVNIEPQASTELYTNPLVTFLIRELCPRTSLSAIGFLLNRDHTTVLYGYHRATALLRCDRAFRGAYLRTRRALIPKVLDNDP